MGKHWFILFLLLAVPGLDGKVCAIAATPSTWFEMKVHQNGEDLTPILPVEDDLREVLKSSLDTDDDSKKELGRDKSRALFLGRESKATLNASGKLSDSLSYMHGLRAPPAVHS